MARMARVVIPNYPHHITQRGNRRQKTFFCEVTTATTLTSCLSSQHNLEPRFGLIA
jgi:REP element-mobilizing transposase RayT